MFGVWKKRSQKNSRKNSFAEKCKTQQIESQTDATSRCPKHSETEFLDSVWQDGGLAFEARKGSVKLQQCNPLLQTITCTQTLQENTKTLSKQPQFCKTCRAVANAADCALTRHIGLLFSAASQTECSAAPLLKVSFFFFFSKEQVEKWLVKHVASLRQGKRLSKGRMIGAASKAKRQLERSRARNSGKELRPPTLPLPAANLPSSTQRKPKPVYARHPQIKPGSSPSCLPWKPLKPSMR